MNFIPLLGKMLRDDDAIEILESLDIEVVYEFDRLHEGQPDAYWASSKPKGFQFKFDDRQSLKTIFLYVTPADGFAAVSQENCDIPFFSSVQDAETFGEARHLQISKGSANFLGSKREWVKLGFVSYSLHYEFHADSLALITISRTHG